MRDIKFRAWNKHLGKMEEEVCINECGEVIHFDYGEYAGVTDDIVMQYTGLKDKNGTEIYEGDIVNFQRTFKCPMDGKTMRNINVNKEITFDSGKFGYLLNKGITAIDSKVLNMEVIGNIYENPELLENER